MIHQIKALYDEGRGLSLRAISRELGVSRNTVRKYLAQSAAEVVADRAEPLRSHRLDEHKSYIEYLLRRFPELSAVKVVQPRYYEPVLDLVPGVQCQVDPGELRGVEIGGESRTVYFVVFVLSFSRLMHVGVSFRHRHRGLHRHARRGPAGLRRGAGGVRPCP